VVFRAPFRVRIHYHASKRLIDPRFGMALLTERDERVFFTETTETNDTIEAIEGSGWVDCVVEAPNVLPGTYYLEVWITEVANVLFADHLRMVGRVQIVVDPRSTGITTWLTSIERGRVYMDCRWDGAGAPGR
jgi:hypothetical protein